MDCTRVTRRIVELYFIVFAIAAADSRAANETVPLTLSVLLPLSSPGIDGRTYLPALDLALEIINNRSDILPGYRLKAVVNDSACSSGPSVRSFIDQIFNPPTKIAIVGPICSTATQPVAELANYWNLVMISAGASSPKLSDTTEYPTFMRTVSSDTAVVDGIVAMMKQYDWSHVACVTQQEFLFTATYSELSDAVVKGNLSESRNFQFGTNDNPQAEVERLYNSPFRIIFLNMYPIKGIEVICQAQALGMTLENGYVWLTYAWYGSNWWKRVPNVQTSYTPFNCSIQQREAFVKGSFSIDHFPFVEEANHDDITELGVSLNSYYSLYYERLERDYSHIPNLGLFTVPFTPLFVDAIWTLALALHATETASNISLDKFNYESKETAERIFKHAMSVKFTGITGQVSYKTTGDRVGYVRYFQYREDSNSKAIISKAFAHISNKMFTYEEGESEQTIFLEGRVPNDKRLDYVDQSIFITCTLFASIGILYATVCLTFNLVFSQKKVIKLSSPFLNIMIVIGAMMFYVDIILLGLDKAQDSLNSLCMVRVWLPVIGFTLLFGTMFAKTWRVYYIFHASNQRKKTNRMLINDAFLFLMVGVLLLIDILFLLPVTIIPSTRLRLVTRELPSTGHELPVEISTCTASDRYIWIGILFVYKGILLTIGLFLAFETRNVKIRQLNDSYLIGMCVYATVVLSIALAPIGMLLETHVDIYYAIIGLMVMFGTTLILSLLFVPKFYSLITDPSGELDSSMSGTNKNGFNERNNTVKSLRQGVDKLKRELTKNRKMGLAEVSLSSVPSNGPKSYTVFEVDKIHSYGKNRSVNDTSLPIVSPQNCKCSSDVDLHLESPPRNGNLQNPLSTILLEGSQV